MVADILGPEERIFIAKPSQSNLANSDDLDIEFQQPAHSMHYINRPEALQHLSLFAFIST